MNKMTGMEKYQDKSSIKISKTYLFLKRLFDIFCGLVGFAVLLPIIIIVKICTLASGDKESIFFTQSRIGQNGKEFKFYKFRSMVPNADEVLFELLKKDKKMAEEYKLNKKLKKDPRITKVGAILRKTSLDELPQVINILKGDMAVIGNRPYLPREKEDMGEYFDDIVSTKPGLTGLWQTAGASKSTFAHRLLMESWYSRNMSMIMDIKIFFLTFKAVIFGHGAGI